MVLNRRNITDETHAYKNPTKPKDTNTQKPQNANPQKEMNNTQKALWFSGMFAAVLSAVIISAINESRRKLDQAVIDIAKHGVMISHNAENIDDNEVRLLDFMDIISGTHDSVIRMEVTLKSFERVD